MNLTGKEKHEAKIRQLEFLNWQLNTRLKEKMYIVDVVERKLESIKEEIHKKLNPKHSGNYLVFNVGPKDVFYDLRVIKADSMEEALIPENESYKCDYVFAIPCFSESKDL